MWVSKYQSYIDIWWACRDERIFVYVSYYLGQNHFNHIDNRVIYLGMKVLTWYIDPNVLKTKIL